MKINPEELETVLTLARDVIEKNEAVGNQLRIPKGFGKFIRSENSPEHVTKLRAAKIKFEIAYLKMVANMFANDRIGCDQEIGIALMNFRKHFTKEKQK